MKKIVMTPNPYRDRNFKYANQAESILKEAGIETRICLAFDVDKNFELFRKACSQNHPESDHRHIHAAEA